MSVENRKPEIYIGIVSRLGIDLTIFQSSLEDLLKEFEYELVPIKLTDEVSSQFSLGLEDKKPEERIEQLIDTCNFIRKRSEKKDILCSMVVDKINSSRFDITGKHRKPAGGKVFFVSQFKRPEEIELFRAIYGRQALVISLHDTTQSRIECLAEKISKAHPEQHNSTAWKPKATELVQRDDEDETDTYGQNVRNAFPLADLVINAATSKANLDSELKRFFDYYFGAPSSAPRRSEIGMYAAHGAALSSTDLSRQVGAAIVDDDGTVVLTGFNDAPRPHGGTYLEDHNEKYRDVDLGYDENDRNKARLLTNLLYNLREDGLLKKGSLGFKIEDAFNHYRTKGRNSKIARSALFDVLEFSRSVHAEMNVITAAARKGISLQGKTLYCTTFPCHNCAKHIVAAGIKEVIYLEPYPKSLVGQLHSDSIKVIDFPAQKIRDSLNRVNFKQFMGIAPHRFNYIFYRGKRKDPVGDVKDWHRSTSTPVRGIYSEGYFDREDLEMSVWRGAVDALKDAFQREF